MSVPVRLDAEAIDLARKMLTQGPRDFAVRSVLIALLDDAEARLLDVPTEPEDDDLKADYRYHRSVAFGVFGGVIVDESGDRNRTVTTVANDYEANRFCDAIKAGADELAAVRAIDPPAPLVSETQGDEGPDRSIEDLARDLYVAHEMHYHPSVGEARTRQLWFTDTPLDDKAPFYAMARAVAPSVSTQGEGDSAPVAALAGTVEQRAKEHFANAEAYIAKGDTEGGHAQDLAGGALAWALQGIRALPLSVSKETKA